MPAAIANEREAPISALIPQPDKQRRKPAPFLDRLLSYAEGPDDDADLRILKRGTVGALWVSLGPNTVTAALMFASGAPLAATALLAMGLIVLGILFTLKARPEAWPGIFHLLVAANFGVSVYLSVLFGGLAESGANFIWGFAGVLAAVVVFRDRRALIWLGVYVILVVGTEVLSRIVEPRYEFADPGSGIAMNLSIVGAFTFLVLLYFIRQRDALQKEAEDLLRNVLPDEIANRLRRSGEMIADHFESASILFADVVDFTPLSADMTPAATVELLNEVFTAFDELVEEAGLEKIKTVGDEYMVAAGVPQPRPDHAHAIADLALAMSDHVARNDVAGRRLVFRMGINSGPVVAGIIGRRKFTYDLWGDTVNTASRMESHGTAGRIQISEATHRLISDDFACDERGPIDVKGKGTIRAWYLNQRATRPTGRSPV